MIGGALINANTFVGGSYLTKYFSGDQNSVEEEKKRLDLTVKKNQAAYDKYQENRTKLLNWIATNDRVKEQAKQNFVDMDYALKLYNSVCNQYLQLSDFYKPSTSQQQDEHTRTHFNELILLFHISNYH